MNPIKLKMMLQAFFNEDIGSGDVTSLSIFEPGAVAQGVLTAKSSGVVSGVSIIKEGYRLLSQDIAVETLISDGEVVEAGQNLAVVKGPVQSVLTGERVLLNLFQRMSGIATTTYEAVQRLNSSKTKICDTRKTTPGLRMLEKYAVKCGGGHNHRIGLYDGVMIKDNHIAFCGSITKAVERARQHAGHMVKIEVETETKEQVIEAVEAGADVIMFDNRKSEEVAAFVDLVPHHIITEASGGIQLEDLPLYRHTGVDYISLGFLTHSYRAMDISFNLKEGVKSECY
ncbi:nicotinate-nucleotide pyrophosphorylase (carboxylating) [Scopulibacillus daqui]|uniref:nicotinate-nucleotide diphosphorylase (carboxylating) n=1 Tax=Scopulibacillus daqui TaxID=1469162 RepID=A0ABS2Q3K6_9BACL|nr:carboxylating nicotinate-nucleotide diphosphorylase [Scopulibacillus daqui]MBM7646102.1 nicotinate-nucleotide pyrophosphorylase (carboxylating) [Scopulibacillus daqui]